MKRFLLFLTCMLMLFGVGKAAETSAVCQATKDNYKSFLESAGWSYSLSNSKSTLSWEGNSSPSKGVQIGSATNSSNTVIITSGSKCAFYGKTIKKISVNASGASGISGNISVSLNSTNLGTKNLSTTATDYDFLPGGSNAVGTIEIKLTQTTSKAFYLNSITVTYDDRIGSDKTSVTLTFPQSSYSVDINDAFSAPAVNSTLPAALSSIDYSSSNTDVATVDNKGNVTLKKVGSTTISASIPENDPSYTSNTASYILTVTDKNSGGSDNEKRVWKLINDPKDVTADGQYIIAHKNGDKYYAMNTGVTSGDKITTDEVTVTNDILTPVTSTAIFILEADTDGNWKLKCPSNENKYLHNPSSTDLNFNSSTSFSNTIAFENNNVKIENGTRRVFANNSNNYGNYANSNWNGNSYFKPSLYKYVISSGLQDVELSFDSEHVYGNKVLGGLIEPELTVKPEAARSAVQYTSSDEGVAKVDKDGNVTLIAAGETTITAEIKDNATYADASASYTLTVTDSNTGENPTPGEGDGSFTITFNGADGNADGTAFSETDLFTSTSSQWNKIIDTQNSDDCIANISFTGSVYPAANKEGLRFGKSGATGKVNITFKEEYQKKIAKYVVSCKRFGSDQDVSMSVGNINFTTNDVTFADQTLTVDIPSVISNFVAGTNSNGKRAYIKSITLYYENETPTQKLGELSVTYGDGKEVENQGKVEVELGETFTFTADNAESIKLDITDGDDNKESVLLTVDQGKASWTVDKVYEFAMVKATATLGDESKDFGFRITVNPPTPGTPVVKIGEEVLENNGSKVVKANTEVSITCENANSIIVKRGEEQVAELSTAPFNYTVPESGTYTFTGTNGENVSETSFTYTFTIAEVDPNAPAVGSTFRQVTKDDELVENSYVIIGCSASNVAFSISEESSNPSTGNVSYENYVQKYYDAENTKVKDDIKFDILTTKGDDILIFKLVKNGEDWGLKTVNLVGTQKYLSNEIKDGQETTNLTFKDEFAPVYFEFSSARNANISFVKEKGRTISFNSNNKKFNLGQYAMVQLYKYSTAKKFEPNYPDVKIKEGEKYTIELDGEHPDVTYRVKGNSIVATVEGNVITANTTYSTDEATIMAMWPETEDWYGNLVEFKVTFRYPAEVGFRYAEVRGKKDVGVAAQAAYYTGDGTLTYYIEKEVEGEWVDASDEIFINKETGMIRPENLINPIIDEPYRVRVHVTGDIASYTEEDAYYTLIIEAPEGGNGEAVSGEAMFNFTDESNPYGFFKFDSNTTATSNKYFSYFEGNIDKYTGNVSENEEDPTTHVPVSQISKDGVTLSFTGEYRWMNKNHLRLYGPNSFIKISAGDGKVKSVSLKVNSGNYFNKNFRVEGEGSGAYDSTTDLYTWTATSDEGVDYVTFEAQTKPEIYTIEVKSLQPSYPDGKQPVNLAFDVTASDVDRHISFFEDQVIPLPTLTYNTNGGTIVFSEAVENGDLVLSFDPIKPASDDTPAEEVKGRYYATDFNDIKVELDEPGVYTFRAEYKGEDFLQGMAILRLNVFPRLTVTTENEDLLSDHELGEDPEITLIHYNEGSNDNSTTVKIPSLDELLKGEDGYRYSTIEVTEVEVKHDGKIEIYSKEVGEGIPATYDFSTDGYVKYTIVYGGEDDFKVESIVNVIFMPHFVDSTDIPGELEITPVVNTTVLYRTYSTPGSNNDKEEVKARRLVDNEGLEWAELTESTKFTYKEALDNKKVKEGDVYVVVAKPTKDISEYVASEKNGLLEGDITEYYLTASGNTTTGIEDVELSEDAEVEYFNLQGVKIKNPEKGGIYIKVTGKKAEKVIL